MIIEIKKKLSKYGTIISFSKDAEQVKELLKHNAVAAFAIIHTMSANSDKMDFGQQLVVHRNVPKLKNVIGNYISQIRGGELVVLLKPDAALLGDATGIHNHLNANRIERAYAMYLGSADAPTAIILSSTLMEHLFHAVPDQLDMDGDWIGFVDGWLKKSLFGGRYFDGNALASLAVKEKVPAKDYVFDPGVPGYVEATPITDPVKRKPGRPKTKK